MSTIAQRFNDHTEAVSKLMSFDRAVLEFAINTIKPLPERLRRHGIDNPEMTGERALKVLTNIRDNDSLRIQYQTIFNQALVLLVSYFASAMHDLFRSAIHIALRQGDDGSQLFREDLRLSLGTLKEYEFNVTDIAPDLLIQAKDLSFQDMQSIAKAFKAYLDIHIEKDRCVNDIIAAQGCRHVIVHTGGRVDERLIRQLSYAEPRKLKPSIAVGAVVQFEPAEVEYAARMMGQYISKVSGMVRAKFGKDV